MDFDCEIYFYVCSVIIINVKSCEVIILWFIFFIVFFKVGIRKEREY